MRTMIVIGTLHAGITPETELIELLEKYVPDQLLVEIGDADVASGAVELYPPEMISAYHWAKRKNIPVRGFDSHIDVMAEGMTDVDNEKVIEESKKMIGDLTWKDFNNEENSRKLDIFPWLTDPAKEKQRSDEMMSNLRNIMTDQGTIVIITGCGHLKEIGQQFPEAQFPLANR